MKIFVASLDNHAQDREKLYNSIHEYSIFLCRPRILPLDPRSRRLFVTSGGLKKVQEIQSEPNSTLAGYIKTINCCFPEEIVRYYSPGYPDSLLERVEQYQPKCPSDTGLGKRLSSEPSGSSVSLVQGEDG